MRLQLLLLLPVLLLLLLPLLLLGSIAPTLYKINLYLTLVILQGQEIQLGACASRQQIQQPR